MKSLLVAKDGALYFEGEVQDGTLVLRKPVRAHTLEQWEESLRMGSQPPVMPMRVFSARGSAGPYLVFEEQ